MHVLQNERLRERSTSGLLDREHLPRARDAFQGVRTAILEALARADRQVANRARQDDLARAGQAGHSGADVHREPADLLAHALALPRVQTGPDCDAHAPHRVDDRLRTYQRLCGSVERCEQTVPGCVDLLTAVPLQLAPSDAVVGVQDPAPRSISHRRGEICRPHDVGEQDRGDEPFGDCGTPHSLQV